MMWESHYKKMNAMYEWGGSSQRYVNATATLIDASLVQPQQENQGNLMSSSLSRRQLRTVATCIQWHLPLSARRWRAVGRALSMQLVMGISTEL
jgi:hypothetical protein